MLAKWSEIYGKFVNFCNEEAMYTANMWSNVINTPVVVAYDVVYGMFLDTESSWQQFYPWPLWGHLISTGGAGAGCLQFKVSETAYIKKATNCTKNLRCCLSEPWATAVSEFFLLVPWDVVLVERFCTSVQIQTRSLFKEKLVPSVSVGPSGWL